MLKRPTLNLPSSERWDKSHRSFLWGWPREEWADWFLMQITTKGESGDKEEGDRLICSDWATLLSFEKKKKKPAHSTKLYGYKNKNKTNLFWRSEAASVRYSGCKSVHRRSSRRTSPRSTISRDKSTHCVASLNVLRLPPSTELRPWNRLLKENYTSPEECRNAPWRIESYWGSLNVVALVLWFSCQNPPLRILFKMWYKQGRCDTILRVSVL